MNREGHLTKNGPASRSQSEHNYLQIAIGPQRQSPGPPVKPGGVGWALRCWPREGDFSTISQESPLLNSWASPRMQSSGCDAPGHRKAPLDTHKFPLAPL